MLTRVRFCLQFSTGKSKLNLKLKLPNLVPIHPPKQTQPKVIKLSRKKIQDEKIQEIQPQYSSSTQYKSKIQAAYENNINKRINENLATANFHEYQFKRGEDLIDNVPVDPYYEYKLEDFKREIQARKKLIDDMKGIPALADPTRFQKLKSLLTGYQTMKHRYEMEQFFKNLKNYPGSLKGPNPQDDPLVYARYVQSIIPQWVRAVLSLQPKAAPNQVQQSDAQDINLESVATDYFSVQPKLQYPTGGQNDRYEQQMIEDLQSVPIITRYSPVPDLPHTKFQQYHSYMQKMKMWGKFRKYYDTVNMPENVENLQKSLNDIGLAQLLKKSGKSDMKQITQQEMQKLKYSELEPKIYSLYHYFKRSISTVKQKQQSYPESPQVYKQLQEDMAVLPVDFYDNNDGFWDEHIDRKLKRYQKVQPLSKEPKKTSY